MSAESVFYVAMNGNDSWSGRLEEPNQTKTDGPFATLERARDASRQTKGASIILREGTYYLDKPFILTPEDSGTIFSAYKDEKPVISGGEKITGWKKATINGKNMWLAEIDDVKSGKWFFRELWVNGQRRTRARHPNKGYLKIAGVIEKTEQWHQGQSSFQFYEGDLKSWENIDGAEVVAMCRWVDSHLPVSSIDESQRLVTFSIKSVFQLAKDDPYYIENSFDFLDEPGEWYLDKKGTLYYMPMPDEDMNEAEVIAPVLQQVLRLEGRPEDGQFIENIIFSGLTFVHSEWWLPEGTSGYAQAAVGVPGMIYGNGVRNCLWEKCSIAHASNYGIELSKGCKRNKILYCDIFDLGAGGIKIGETVIRNNETEITSDNEIRDCHIHDGGMIFHPAVGIWIGQSPNNRIAYNHIHDFYYTGVSIGWTWGYGPAIATGNILEANHIHHIGIKSNGDGPILSDMGGVYTLGLHEGSVIRHNVFHDIAAIQYGGWGIYFDEGTTHIIAENNLVYNTTHGGFHQHYGKENIVRNNIFAFGRDWQVQRSRPEEHVSFIFKHNIVFWDKGIMLSGNLANFNIEFDNNLYWCVDKGEMKFNNLSWDEWQNKGMDKNSIIADPMFADPYKFDFRLMSDSPTKKIGFVPFNF
ncbi:MAG: right-handed parallel beta-helix repeat-containing protein [bacterium]